MLPPVTKREKLNYTVEVQIEKAYDELLGELYYNSKYNGYVDVWFNIGVKKGKMIVEVFSKKVEGLNSPISKRGANRYLLIQDKGIKNIIV